MNPCRTEIKEMWPPHILLPARHKLGARIWDLLGFGYSLTEVTAMNHSSKYDEN